MNIFQKQLLMADGRSLGEQMNDGVYILGRVKAEPLPERRPCSITDFEADMKQGTRERDA